MRTRTHTCRLVLHTNAFQLGIAVHGYSADRSSGDICESANDKCAQYTWALPNTYADDRSAARASDRAVVIDHVDALHSCAHGDAPADTHAIPLSTGDRSTTAVAATCASEVAQHRTRARSLGPYFL
jgi:hypothetical protein